MLSKELQIKIANDLGEVKVTTMFKLIEQACPSCDDAEAVAIVKFFRDFIAQGKEALEGN